MSTQIESVEALNKVVSLLQTEQKRLADRGDSLATNLETKVADLTAAVRQVQADRAAAGKYTVDSNDDREMRCYYEQDAEVLAGKTVTRDSVTARGDIVDSRRPFYGGADSAVRLFGVEYADGGYEAGLLDDPEPRTQWQLELQRIYDMRNFVRSCQPKARRHTPGLDRKLRRHLSRGPADIQRIFTDSAGIGAEWVIDTPMPELQRELMMARRVEALFRTMALPSGGAAINPFLSTELRPYLAGTPTDDNPAQLSASSATTAQRTVEAVKLAVRMVVDRDASEDSILAFEPLARQMLVSALVDGTEDAIINGDTAGTHQDTGLSGWDIRSRWGSSGLGGSGDHRRAWIGLRARATDVSSTADGSSAQTFTGLMTGIAALDSPHGLGAITAITSPEYYLLKILLWSEVVTVDKYGPAATIVTGELAKAGPARIVLSEFVDAQYNASGVYDDSTKTKTGLVLCNTDRFLMGVRRGARVEVDTDITRDVLNYVATERKVLHQIDSSTKKNVRWIYNLSAS